MTTGRITRARWLGLIGACALVCVGAAHAQVPPPVSDAGDPTITAARPLNAAAIKAKIDEIDSRKEIAPAVRDQALALYRNALSQLDAAEANAGAAAKFQEAIEASPKRTAEVRAQLKALTLPPQTTAAISDKSLSQMSLGEIEQRLDSTRAEIATLKTQLGEFDATLRGMASRPTGARDEQSAERQKLDELPAPSKGAEANDDATVVEARRTALAAERQARAAKINMLEQELISLPARQALAEANRDLAAANLDRLEQQVPALEARINDLRQTDALRKQYQAERVTRALSGQDPILEDYAKATAALRQKETDLARLTETEQATQSSIDAEIARIRENTIAAQQILDIGSVGEELGEFLREMRAELSPSSGLDDRIQARAEAIVDARLQRLNIDKTSRMLADPERAADRLLRDGDPAKRAKLLPTLTALVTARSDALARLSEAYTRRIDQLAKVNASERELRSQTKQLDSLLNDRLLWLPSSAPLGWAWFEQISTSWAWGSDIGAWGHAARMLNLRSAAKAGLTFTVLIAFGVLWGFRGRLRRRLAEIAEAAKRPSTDGYLLTPRALLSSALIPLHWPLLLGYMGWVLTTPPDASEFATSVGSGLLASASVILLLRFLQLLCIENGLFRAHFDWSARVCQRLGRNLAWLVVVAAPIAFVLGMIEVSKSQVYRDGLGRLVVLMGAIATAIFVARVFSPRKGVFAEYLPRDGALWFTRGLWFSLLWGAPLALGALAVSGYYDSAAALQQRLAMTVAIGVLGLLVYGVATRQLLVARRRLERMHAMERREKARAAAARETPEASGDATPQVLEAAEVDVASISQQTRTLLRMLTFVGLAVGLWMVWRPLLPALGFLDSIALWTQTITTDAGTKIVPVTLSNLLLALAISAVTFIAAHNLPGLLEIMLLQRLKMQPGTRYAVSAISRYSILTIGLLIAFNRVGADWSQMQWIVAALGVGVGFGLQEIVANFVSGLIILFERPVRVGDTVTIGDLSGTVSRIQIRATSITDWDNREILVPNKRLISDQVINWTLSDTVTRLLIEVGVAYGSDAALAQKVMLDAVKANPLVLADPPASVFFLGFGDSALNYEVRAFVAEPAHRLPVLHDLHIGIEQALRENGITIPFPQRDLHLKFGEVAEAAQEASVKALREKLKQAG